MGGCDFACNKPSPGSKTYSDGEAADAVEVFEAMVLRRSDEHLRANSSASIQQRPAALLGARKMQWEVGRGCTTAPII